MRNIFRATALVFLLTAACESPDVLQPGDEGMFKQVPAPEASTEDLLKAVRQATARFHSTTQAVKAGYQADDHCVAVPGLGGMGYHWKNPELIDPIFDPLQPEMLLYARGPNGQLQLVGVEYLMINVGQERPSFGGYPLDVNGTPVPVPHYSLHVWLYEDNPNGIFAPFNPNVSCSESHAHGS